MVSTANLRHYAPDPGGAAEESPAEVPAEAAAAAARLGGIRLIPYGHMTK